MRKHKVRLTSKGWYFLWLYQLYRIQDEVGLSQQWVGPFRTMQDAIAHGEYLEHDYGRV